MQHKQILLRKGRYKVVEIQGLRETVGYILHILEDQRVDVRHGAHGTRWLSGFKYALFNEEGITKAHFWMRLNRAKHQTPPCTCGRLKHLHRRTKECT